MKRFLTILSATIVLAACSPDSDRADAYGNFESDTYYISTETSGTIRAFPCGEGDQLSKGQLVAIIDTTQLSLQKGQVTAQVAALKSKLQNVPVQLGALDERKAILQRELLRAKALLADSAATQKQVDDLSGELEVVSRQYDALKSQLSTSNQGLLAEIEPMQWQIKLIEDRLLKSRITMPAKGTVLEKLKEAGELVMPGQPILKVANLEEMVLRGFVSGSQLGSLSLGQEVSVSIDLPNGEMKSYPATISWIASEAEFTPKIIQTREERVSLVYAVKFRVKNDGLLKIGMPGEVTFQSKSNP